MAAKQFISESRLETAAATNAESTKPTAPMGNCVPMKNGKTWSAFMPSGNAAPPLL